MNTVTAKVTVKDSQGKEVATREYQKVVFQEPKDRPSDELLAEAIAHLQKDVGEKGDPVAELLSHLTYAYDLGVRSGIRQELVSGIAGPDKAIAKAIDDFMKARAAVGKPVSREDAEKKVRAMLEA